ncbi:MAG: penicillin-binding protein 2 [Proteobacteria bacterium]|nr:penicillin-binding protein 2 [Pseudomonadota bacterium]
MNEPAIFFEDANERQGSFLRRTVLVGGGAVLGLGALVTRLGMLQLVEAGRYKTLSSNNQWNYRVIPPPRGRILDRNGVVLAGNRPSFRVLVIRDETKDLDQTLNLVGELIPSTVDRRRQLLREISQSPRFTPVAVASDLSWEDFAKVNLHANELPGVMADMNEARYYPFGGAFAHVIGYVAKVSDNDMKKAKEAAAASGTDIDPMLMHPGFRIGKQGIEKAFDKQLRGQPGGQKVEVDSRGRVVGEDRDGDRRPTPGDDIVLTIDADVQNRALEVFGKESGAAVVMDVRNGDVLCLLSAPSFDANAFVSGVPGATYKALNEYDHHPLLNKATSGTFPAGSTFKTMVALAALEKGISPKDTYVCNGVFPFGNHVFKCDQHHGAQDMHGAIVTSCDVFFYQTALKVGPDLIAATARKFGINAVFEDIHIPQQRGTLPDIAWKKKTYKDPRQQIWYPGETPSFGIGQGYLAVNPLQLCVMTSRLANGKKALLPRLVKSIGGKEMPPGNAVPDLPVNPDHLQFVREAMASVANDARGTAFAAAQLGLGPIKMAGKTGTAQSHTYDGGHGAHGAVGEWKFRDHGWFVAFAPYDEPRYAMAVLVEHGGFGASAAAPKAREIMRTTLLKDAEIMARIQKQPGARIDAAPPPLAPDAMKSDLPPDMQDTPAAPASTSTPAVRTTP